jgi:hypothetical protein
MPLDLLPFDPAAVKAATRQAIGEHGTLLIGAPGLWVALVAEADQFEAAAADLKAQMTGESVQSGILILSQAVAASTFGPVPAELLSASISMHRSSKASLNLGAYAFLHEYLCMLTLMERSLADLEDAVVKFRRGGEQP